MEHSELDDMDYLDLYLDIIETMVKVLGKSLKEVEDNVETSKIENIFIILCDHVLHNEKLLKFIKITIIKLDELIEKTLSDNSWHSGDPGSYEFHLNKYSLWKSRLEQFLASEK